MAWLPRRRSPGPTPDKAQSAYSALKQRAQALSGLPDTARQTAVARRTALVERLDGRWSKGDCAGASTWHVEEGARLVVDWPGKGKLEERILRASGDRVTTLSVAPDWYRGQLFEYRPSADAIEVRAIESGKTGMVRKCAQ